MSPRRRLGVALLVDPPVAHEVNGLRRALGDGLIEAVPPHLTLVPPVNVRAGSVVEAVDVVRRAAYAQEGPLVLELGPVASFHPDSPVLYLAVGGLAGPGAAGPGGPGGPPPGGLARLQRDVLAGPLARPLRWPWVPHVTVADDASAPQVAGALAALGSYVASVSFDRVVLMEEVGHRWQPLADACLGPPGVIGRGGLEIEVTEGRTLGPDALAMVQAQPEAPATPLPAAGVVLTARREGLVAGVAATWHDGYPGGAVHVGVMVAAGARRQGVGRALVMALEVALARRGWGQGHVRGHGSPGFFARCSAWSHGFEPAGINGPAPGH